MVQLQSPALLRLPASPLQEGCSSKPSHFLVTLVGLPGFQLPFGGTPPPPAPPVYAELCHLFPTLQCKGSCVSLLLYQLLFPWCLDLESFSSCPKLDGICFHLSCFPSCIALFFPLGPSGFQSCAYVILALKSLLNWILSNQKQDRSIWCAWRIVSSIFPHLVYVPWNSGSFPSRNSSICPAMVPVATLWAPLTPLFPVLHLLWFVYLLPGEVERNIYLKMEDSVSV